MSKFHEIHKRFFECIIKFDLFTYLKLNSIKNYGVWKDCEINLQNLVKSWNFGCKRPLNWHFLETRAGWLRDWTYDHYLVWKGLIWTESDFTGNQSVKFESTSISCICEKSNFKIFRKMSFWGHLEIGFRQDKVDSAATTSSKLNQAVAIFIFDWLEWFAEIMTPRQITSGN